MCPVFAPATVTYCLCFRSKTPRSSCSPAWSKAGLWERSWDDGSEVMTQNWIELEKQYFFPTSKRAPVTLVRGEGTRVWDEDGREYLDFVAGIASVSLGHCHPEVVAAITRQASQLMLPSNNYYSIPQI